MTAVASAPMNARTKLLLHGPVVRTVLALAWPTVLVQTAQAMTGLVETFWIAKLGTDALAGMALVFPAVYLMQMISGGAMGGGISSAIARALGGGKRDEANALVLHAIVANLAIGCLYAALALIFGPALYHALGGHGASLAAALRYSNIVFAGSLLIWLVNAFASVLRGTGNMLVPSAVICGGVVLLIPLSPCLIFGIGPFPRLGVGGGATALLIYYAAALAVLAWYVISGRSIVRLEVVRLRWERFWPIVRVGAVASLVSLQTNVTIALATGLVGAAAGASAIAGFGTGARLEYLLIPVAFGIGVPLVAMVGTCIGAGNVTRATHVAWVGAAITAVITEAIGLCAAVWPNGWLKLFGNDRNMIASGAAYLRAVGPFYGFFGLGMSLYFSSQGAGRLKWPLIAGLARVCVAVIGGYVVLRHTGSLTSLYAAVALGLVTFGLINAAAVWRGTFQPEPNVATNPPGETGTRRGAGKRCHSSAP
jgi:putative MATE family efflux protein